MVNFRIPMVAQAFFPATETVQLKAALLGIINKYKAIKAVASLTNVDANLIASVIFLESRGVPDVVSGSGAVGLMQLTPATASGAILLAKRKKLISPVMATLLLKYIGNRYNNIIKQAYPALPIEGVTAITEAELMQPDLNIILGSLFLSVLIAESTENGVVRLDKVISRYNRGYYSKPKGTITDVLAASPSETRKYILKLVGVNSCMDILSA